MKVLVTGGFGYLGGRLVLGLAARGHQPVLAGRRIRESGSLGLPSVTLDVLAPIEMLRASLRSNEVEAIVHLASLDEIESVSDPELALRVSGEGTRRLIEAAQAEGIERLVYFSTFHVYGRRPPSLITEDVPTRASHPYAIAHLAGEGFCREANEAGRVRCVAFRMSNGYGAPADLSVERWSLAHNGFCREATLDGRVTLLTSGVQRRDLVWLDDVAQAVHLVLLAPADQLGEAVFNLGGGWAPTIFELASIVAERAQSVLGREVPVIRPASGPDSPELVYSIDRLRELGYVPTNALARETDALLSLLRSPGERRP